MLFACMLVLGLLSTWALGATRLKWAMRMYTVFWVFAESLFLKSTSTRHLNNTASRILFASWMIGTFIIGQYLTGQLSGLDSYRALHDRIRRMRSEVPITDIYSLRTLRQVVAGDTIILMDATGNRVYVAPHCEALQPAYFHMSQQRLETADFRWYMNKRLDPKLVAAMDRR
ncbi:hypothetical protein HPB52_000297 [Rhipicephalus sanguineus]|uniref:Ionotropic receptor n=1 Tax=Rhipicephalus sanguineus TaxID=34632 RepID=A0A9D4PE40_RHISA|nr:hypothetical protein HPB52_000297 [Rhipicephalus sanguineus]